MKPFYEKVICEVETYKTSVPVPSPVAGVIEELLVEDGSTVNPGMKLVKIKVGAGLAAPKSAAPEPVAAAAPPPPPPPPPPPKWVTIRKIFYLNIWKPYLGSFKMNALGS